MTRDAFLEELEQKLKAAKPGLPAQLKMAPHPRPGQKVYTEVEDICQKAGVMVLVYPRQGIWHLVLIRRTPTVLHHKDQIGFPGGQMEPGEDFIRTALRETEEEIGVFPSRIKIIGPLTPLFVPPSNFCIYPVVAAADGPLSFNPYPDEVAEIIEVPLRHLTDPRNVREENWTIRGERVNVPFFAFGEHKIWGATAMILAEFLDVLQRTKG